MASYDMMLLNSSELGVRSKAPAGMLLEFVSDTNHFLLVFYRSVVNKDRSALLGQNCLLANAAPVGLIKD